MLGLENKSVKTVLHLESEETRLWYWARKVLVFHRKISSEVSFWLQSTGYSNKTQEKKRLEAEGKAKNEVLAPSSGQTVEC